MPLTDKEPRMIAMLFNTLMVKAILADCKTKTRRVIMPQPVLHTAKLPMPLIDYVDNLKAFQKKGFTTISTKGSSAGYMIPDCRYGVPGDIIYVKETHYRYGTWVKNGTSKTGNQKWKFVADTLFSDVLFEDTKPVVIQKNTDRVTGWYKRPSLFLEKIHARIFLKIKDIGVERLQDISDEDAIAEGIEHVSTFWHPYYGYELNTWREYLVSGGTASPIYSFETLWRHINGLESWNENPFVWVISFEKIEKL